MDPYYIAILHTALGEKELAFEWLKKAFAGRSGYLAWIKVDPTS